MSYYQQSSSRSNRIEGSEQDLTQTMKAAPLLLKPNGAPVFQNVGPDEIGVTMKRAQETAELERTVKAHSFVVGKKIQNSTDIQKSAAQDQSFPVKVLYVKPGIVKQEKRKSSQPVVPTGIPSKEKLINVLDLEVSMGEISGIFKKEKKRVQSAPQKEVEKRMKAKKEYAEQVKMQNKIQAEQRQRILGEQRGKSGETPKEEPKLEIPKPKLPHSQNRYQGKFDSMTKELFKKAQLKLREDQEKAKGNKDDQKAKKEREAQIQEEIKLLNREKVMRQKESGNKPMTLKQKEEAKKYGELQRENNEMRQRRREVTEKGQEGRARQLALHNVSQKKLAEHQQKKLQDQFEREEFERIQQIVNRQEAMIRNAALNKDIIDFTDPTLGMPSHAQFQEEVEQPDEEAQQILKREARQRALVETRQKRKNQELMKKMLEDQEKQKKEQMMADLESKLEQDRQEFRGKQRMAIEREANDAKKRVKESKKSSRGNTKDRSYQLNELRDWIDDQMNIEDVKTIKDDTIKSQPKIIEPSQDPALLKYQLPGNHLLDLEDERRIGVRQNRYGIDGDNGYDDIVGFKKPPSDAILDFVQLDNQQYEVKSDDSYDIKPVKQEKRKIVNQPVDEPVKFPAPGMLNLKMEADRQRSELLKKQAEAATVMQKWARGWEARKRAQKLRHRTRKDIEQGYTDYTDNFKINEKFNLNRFINEKQRLRKKYGTDAIDDDSISEQIGEASIDIQTESYIKSQILGSSSRPAPAVQNFFVAPIVKKNMEYDPLSLIQLYAQRNTVAASPEQLIPEKEKPHKQRGKSGAASVRINTKEVIVQQKRSKSSKTKPQKWDDEISEDIIQSSKAEEQYSENFASDDIITESIPSFKGPITKDSESIGESIVVQSGLKISESIPEETASIMEDDIPEDVIESKEDIISEASYLRNSGSSEIKESIAGYSAVKVKASPPPPPPKKIDRIRDKIKEDFDNDGQETYKSLHKAQEIKKQQEEAEQERNRQYRLSKQIIQDYEENKTAGTESHKLIMKDLTEELNRYEAAVSGSIFIEQFQGIVQKNLAQKDIMMLGQRLHELEMENKHKQEIADIRAEQIRMMSQLMLLNAGGSNMDKQSSESLRLHQEQIMGNIQKLIEKPIIIEKVGLDQEIIESIKESMMTEKFRASISQSKVKESIQDEIEDEIESDIEESVVDESIQESIQLSNARRVLGSEQTLIQKSKEMLSDKKKNPRAPSPFEKNTFQNYTSDKFKDLLFNDGSQMDDFLDQIEIAVAKKSETEKKQLKKQLEMKKITPQSYSKKAKDLDKWVTGERAEINQKRKKVKDTCQEIGVFMKKIEQDKQLIMETGLESGRSTPRKFGQSQGSMSTSGLKQIQDQLEDVRAGVMRPETKYITKKRDFVRQLMAEKKEAIDKGVQDRMKDMESDMVDEMMQAALTLDVEDEIEKRISMAKQMVEEGRIDESASKSMKSEQKYKKNVRFQQPSPKGDKYSSSAGSHHQPESSLRSRSNKIEASMGQDDMIGESIAMEESIGQSSAKKSKVDSSGKYSASAGKSKNSEKIQEQDENSLSRDDEEIEEDDIYSNDFASRSIQSATVSSKKNKLASSAKNADFEESGYSDAFDEQSMGQSISQSKGLKSMTNNEFKDIEIVDEEDDSNPDDATSSKPSPNVSRNEPSISDREMIESTRSVQWEFQLQDRKKVEIPAPEPEYPSEEEEELEEEPTEKNISEEYDVQQDEMEDFESNPTGSLQNSYPKDEDDIQAQADQITEQLLQEILRDFVNDSNVKMVVEDDIDEDEFEDKWPYTLDKKVEEPEKPMTSALQQAQTPEVNEKSDNEVAKKRHDINMKKYHAEQDIIRQSHLKTKEYLEFITQIVDKEVLQQNLQKPIEHDPLKILEKIQAFDTEDEIEMTAMANSQQQSALPTYLFDEIQKRYEEIHTNEKKSDDASLDEIIVNVSQEAKQVHHLAIFDAFNEALDLERPYKFKGLPNPWSKQTRITNENLNSTQVDIIVQKAMERVIGWDATGAGTKYAPAPPPPPLQQDYDAPYPKAKSDEECKTCEKQEEDERNKAERSERLGILLTKEVHQRENDWLDYEIEDTQVRFDLADMILEELADEVTQFLIIKQRPNIEIGSSNSYDEL